MANDVVYVHHRGAEYNAFRAPTGMSGRWTKAQTEKVAAHARLLAPKPGLGKGYATGETATSIKSSAVSTGRTGPEATVLSDTDHAVFVHEGTAPHIIKPRFASKLVFFSRGAGKVIFDSKVFHPGTKANPFLVNALREIFGGPGR
jgi:hypothetical protein